MLFVRPHTRDHRITLTLIEPLIFLYLQKCNYFTLSTTATSHIAGQGSKSMMNASQTNSSAQIKDLRPSLVPTQSQKVLKTMLHKTYATSQWINNWSIVSPSHQHMQHQPADKKPHLIRLSHVKTLKLLSNQRMRPFLGAFLFCFVC